MRNFSNQYIYTFSAIMVISVAAVLAIIALALKETQGDNVKVEQFQNILSSVQIESTPKDAKDLFDKYITESYVITPDNQKVEGENALTVDLKKEVAIIDKVKILESKLEERRLSPFKVFLTSFISFEEVDKAAVAAEVEELNKTRKLPVYICEKDGAKFYIFPVRGKGLWGPIWGYVSLKDDLNTIYGAVFDHKGETPGLGAEINQDWFSVNFENKQIFDADSKYKSVEVVKGGASDGDLYKVDAISGGTITSKGVEEMIYDCLRGYITFIETQRN